MPGIEGGPCPARAWVTAPNEQHAKTRVQTRTPASADQHTTSLPIEDSNSSSGPVMSTPVFIFEKASFLVLLRVLCSGWDMATVSRFLAVTEEDKKHMKQCRKCGAWSPMASEACSTCGGKEFWGQKAPKEKKARRASSPTTASLVETRKVCQTCGTSNPEYVKNYCVRCGARL